jgi:hypothetical protein
MNTLTQKLLGSCLMIFTLYLPGAALAQGNEAKEAKLEDIKTLDDAVSIHELRIRGETKRTTVKPKHAPEYQISPDTARKSIDDKSQGKTSWNLFTF